MNEYCAVVFHRRKVFHALISLVFSVVIMGLIGIALPGLFMLFMLALLIGALVGLVAFYSHFVEED